MTPARPRDRGRKLSLYLSISSQILSLLRNIVVARLLGPEEFGVAAVIILTITFLDSFSNAGPQNLLVQAKDEDGRPLLAAAHAVTLGRGLSTAGLLLIIAMPLSQLFGLRLGWLAIIGLAISSIFSGLLHRGVRVVQRDGDFRLEGASQVAGDVAALGVAAVVAYLTHSHIAIVAGLIARSAVTTLTSHVLAPQPYELSWARSLLARFWAFGWPLMINGPLLFLSAQADRLFISREIGPTALGIYSAITVLIASPGTAMLRWLGTILMPSLARAFHQQNALPPKGVVYDYTALMLLAGALMFAGFATLGSVAVKVLYGEGFVTSTELVALIGCLQVFRFLRGWPAGLALAVAASGGILVSTTVRLLALPIGYAGLVFLGGLPGLLIGFIVGEALALVVSLVIVNHNARRGWRTGLLSIAAFGMWSCATMGGMQLMGDSLWGQAALFPLSFVIGAALLLLSISPSETRVVARRLSAAMASRFAARR